jgi:hypothetical protein
MFDPGTKVILVESSLHKTVGPRKGSIGYISNSPNTRIIPIITEGFSSFSVVAALCEIIFIRFGFEERGRMERKTVISVFPVVKNGSFLNKNDGEIDFGATKHMKDLCNMIVSQKDSYSWENVRDVYGASNNVPIVLATPLSYDATDLTTCDEIEFKAWLSSYLTSIPVNKFIQKTLQSLHYTKYNDTELNKSETWDYLYRLVGDREFRNDYVRLRSKDIEQRRKSILLVRKIIAAMLHTKLKRIKEIIEELQFAVTHDFISACYDALGPHIYNNTAISLFVKMCESYHTVEMSKIAKDFIATISECTSLSDDMLSSNSGFGYTSLNSK